jgi:hypothetical protein
MRSCFTRMVAAVAGRLHSVDSRVVHACPFFFGSDTLFITCLFVRSRSRTDKHELQSKVHLKYVKESDGESLNVCDCKICYNLPVRTVFINCGHIDIAPCEPFGFERSCRRSMYEFLHLYGKDCI